MEATKGQLDWAGHYYEAIEHLLWYPDWITSRQPDGTRKSVRDLMDRLRRLEAGLHHNFQTFFALAPTRLITKLIGVEVADHSAVHIAHCREWEPVMVGHKSKSLNDLCQPDIFVEGPGLQVAVEIKRANGKSSLEQVLKYAALMLLRSGGTQRHLVYVAPNETFADLWTGKAYADPASLKARLLEFDDPVVDRKFKRFGTSLDAVKAGLQDLRITWRSIREVRREVRKELEQQSHGTPSAASEVYVKLLSGFERELGRWQGGD